MVHVWLLRESLGVNAMPAQCEGTGGEVKLEVCRRDRHRDSNGLHGPLGREPVRCGMVLFMRRPVRRGMVPFITEHEGNERRVEEARTRDGEALFPRMGPQSGVSDSPL